MLPLTPDPCLWCSVTSRHVTPPAALVPSDGPGHQEPGSGGGRPAGRHQPRLRHRRLVQRHRQRQLPVLDLLHPGHDLRAGRDLPVQPLRPHQGTAARRWIKPNPVAKSDSVFWSLLSLCGFLSGFDELKRTALQVWHWFPTAAVLVKSTKKNNDKFNSNKTSVFNGIITTVSSSRGQTLVEPVEALL